MARDRFIMNKLRIRVKTEGLQRRNDERLDKKTDYWLLEAEKRLANREKMVKID